MILSWVMILGRVMMVRVVGVVIDDIKWGGICAPYLWSCIDTQHNTN